MKYQKAALIVIVIGALVLLAGCLNNTPPATPPVQTTTPVSVVSQSIPVPSEPVPVSVTAVPTSAIQNTVATAYVKRPYGFVPSTYHPGYQAKLLESHLDKNMATGDRTIVGTVKNIGSETIELVVVTADLYNSQGYLIGTSSVDIYYLQPGKTWQFRTEPILFPDYSYYEISAVFTG